MIQSQVSSLLQAVAMALTSVALQRGLDSADAGKGLTTLWEKRTGAACDAKNPSLWSEGLSWVC